MEQSGLPFSEVLEADSIESVFAADDRLFGEGAICWTATTLWAFLGQVLCCGKQAACRAAAAAIIGYRQLLWLAVPTEDTSGTHPTRQRGARQNVPRSRFSLVGVFSTVGLIDRQFFRKNP